MANGIGGREGARKRPEEVTLSREDGEALIERLEKDALTAEDWLVLVKVLTFYFWLLFALREPPTSGATAAGEGQAATKPGRPQHPDCTGPRHQSR